MFSTDMFRQKPESDQTRIRLPRRSMQPTRDYLEFAFTQAFQYRDKEVEISWLDYSSSRLFSLIVKAEADKSNPYWTLSEETNEGSQFLWSGETSDFDVISQKIALTDPVTKNMEQISSGQQSIQGPAKPDSPYRKMFSGSYHGINPPSPNSLRESFSKMRAVNPPSFDSASVSTFPVNPTPTYARQTESTDKAVSLASSVDMSPLSKAMPEPLPETAGVPQAKVLPGTIVAQVKEIIVGGLASLLTNQNVPPVYVVSDTVITGTLEQSSVQNKHLIKLVAANKLTGQLEIVNQQEGAGRIFFEDGIPYSAYACSLESQNSELQGDEAIVEIILWSSSSFRFLIDERAQVKDVSNKLEMIISDSVALRDQLGHLINAGMKPQSLIIKKQDGLGDNELRVLLSKNNDEDATGLITLYRHLPKRFTVNQLFDGEPYSKAHWIPVIFSFLTTNLIDIKAPLAVNESALNFLGDTAVSVQSVRTSFLRPETGVFTYPALLYFLQYEYLRYQSYDCPLSLIVFEMNKSSNNPLGGLDLISQQETLVALRRLTVAKRVLDTLGHFEAINYAVLLPDTTLDVANKIAKNMVEVLNAQPLSPEVDASLLRLSFGIGSIPNDCIDLESLIVLTKKALLHSKNSDFIIVHANSIK